MPDNEPSMIAYIEPDEDQDVFKERVMNILQETKHLGPMVHTAILAQIVGNICASNPEWGLEDAGRTMIMNLHQGYMNMVHHIMEESAESSIN